MSHEEVHKVIQGIFHFRGSNISVPWGTSMRYKRELFPILFAKCGFNVAAEIGVRRGNYAQKLFQANPNLKLYCIDPWFAYQRYSQEMQDPIYAEAMQRLSKYNAIILRKTSMEALGDIPDGSLDFIHIDGNHEFDFVCMDIICWSKKVKSGGIIACHDYHAGPTYGIREAVDAYTHAHHIDPWYVTKEVQPTAFWVNP